MSVYQTRRGARNYGLSVGILQLDCSLPFVPGDVDNASTYRYPVIYRHVPGLSTKACLGGAPELEASVVAAAVEMEKQGVKAISSDCGFMLQFQRAVRQAVNIPVCMSSLLQLPMISAAMSPKKSIAIITADGKNLSEAFLDKNGVMVPNKLIIRGLEDQPEFKTAVFDEKGSIDAALVEKEVVGACLEIQRKNPDLGAVLFECSMLPPYARATQAALGGLPVYDFITMIDWLQSATHQRRYDGYY